MNLQLDYVEIIIPRRGRSGPTPSSFADMVESPGTTPPRLSPPPSLSTLFNTPTPYLRPASQPCSPLPLLEMSRQSMLSSVIPASDSSSAVPPGTISNNKGKDPILHDRLTRELQVSRTSPNSSNLRYHKGSVTSRQCRLCQSAGCEKPENAAWCKERRNASDCFLAPLTTEDPKDHDSISDLSERDTTQVESALLLAIAPACDVGPWLEDQRYMKSIVYRFNSKLPRECIACRAAGKVRADRAAWCKGRNGAQKCSFVDRDIESRAQTRSATHAQSSSDTPIACPPSTGASERSPRTCKVCRGASVKHLRPTGSAHSCRSSNQCRSEPRVDESAVLTSPAAETLLSPFESPTIGSLRTQTPAKQQCYSQDGPGTIAAISRRGSRTTRRRVILTPPASSLPPEFEPSPMTAAPSPVKRRGWRPDKSSRLTSPSTAPSADTLVMAPRSPLLSSSMPPSSPPPLPKHFEAEYRAVGHPTPSPSLSAVHLTGSPPVRSSLPPSPSPVVRQIMPLRSVSRAMRPTPSTSTVASRSVSTSSDNLPLFLNRKRSALSRVAGLGYTSPHRAKKTRSEARSSLQPRSAPYIPSTDPFMAAEDADDELRLGSTVTPDSSIARWSPRHDLVRSSSPFSRDICVRAADVGFQLGPMPTGRLPSGMLAALAPSVSSFQPSGEKQMMSSTTIGALPTIPTPPRSMSSATPSSAVPRRTKTPIKFNVGLMLPPPVPMTQRGYSARPATPVVDTKSPGIRFTTMSPAMLRARSRPRSVSVLPAPRSQWACRPETPVRKSRSERDLAKVAQVAGDEAGLEWGMDDEVGEELGRIWREGSVVRYLD